MIHHSIKGRLQLYNILLSEHGENEPLVAECVHHIFSGDFYAMMLNPEFGNWAPVTFKHFMTQYETIVGTNMAPKTLSDQFWYPSDVQEKANRLYCLSLIWSGSTSITAGIFHYITK